jgi:hypothetical protein
MNRLKKKFGQNEKVQKKRKDSRAISVESHNDLEGFVVDDEDYY